MKNKWIIAGQVRQKIKLIKAFIGVLDTCKNDEDPSRNESTRVLTALHVLGLWRFFQTFKGS